MRRLKTLVTALFITTISASAALAQGMYVEPGRYEIEIGLTGKVLDLRKEDKRSVQQYYRGNVSNQQWDIESAGSNNYYIKSAETGAYLGVENAREGGRVVATNSRRGGDTWRFVDLGNGNVMIVHRSGMTLDLANGATQDGAPIQVWSQARNANQQFRLVRALASATYDPNNSDRATYNEGYRAGVNDRIGNQNNNYRRHRNLYDRNTEREFQQGYSAGYESGRYNDRPNDRTDDNLDRMTQIERRNYDLGFQLGQQDARANYNSNYRRHNNRFNARQAEFFRRGYEAGYDRSQYRNNDQFDLSRLSQYERRAYDDGYNLGRQDARSGSSLNYRRYQNRFNTRNESFFQRGYEVGYNSFRR